MNKSSTKITLVTFVILLAGLLLYVAYSALTSDNFSLYSKTGIILPKSATNVINQENQNWMGDGDQALSFTASKEDLEQMVSEPLGNSFSTWQKGPRGKDKTVPASQWINSVQSVENTAKIYYATKNIGPKDYESSEYILIIVDFKSLKVIVFQHNA